MTISKLYFLGILFSILAFGAWGQEKTIQIDAAFRETLTPPIGSIAFYEQGQESVVIADELRTKQLAILPSSVPNFGFITHDVWFRSTIVNRSLEPTTLYLLLSNPNLDVANLIVFRGKQQIDQQKFSDLSPTEKRKWKNRKPVFDLHLLPEDTLTLLLQVNNGGEQFHFDLSICEQQEFEQQENAESYFLGIFMGLLIFVIIFNIYMWALTKDRLSLIYSFYLIALLLLQLSLLGFGKMYLWADSPFWSNHANPFFASVSVFFLLQFSRQYLNLKELLPKADRFFFFLSFPIMISALIALVPTTSTYTISIVLINGLTLLLNFLILPLAFIALRKGYRPALLFLIAFSILVISVFAFILKNFGLIPSTFYTDFGFQIGSSIEVLLFSLGIIIRYRNVQREAIVRLEEINRLKEAANEELELKVTERTAEIAEQKLVIEDKNKEIISSIAYARRIQEAILPDTEKIARILPNTRLFYQPKDIVSGDFYWVEEKHLGEHNYCFFAVADCTGHGVPGAMMSVLCHAVLNRTLEASKTPNAADFLERTDHQLKMELSRNNQEIYDGMDLSLAILHNETSQLFYAGANNPLWILRGEELLEYDAIRRPIGLGGSKTPFELMTIQLEHQDRVFLFSDGFVDQFGGKDAKKLRKKQLREWIRICAALPSDTLLQFLQTKFMDWKGEEEQTDDVCMLLYEHIAPKNPEK